MSSESTINNQIEKLNDEIERLTDEKNKLVEHNDEKTRDDVKSKYGNFLYVIKLIGTGRGNYCSFTRDQGCFSDKKIAQDILDHTTYSMGSRYTYSHEICIREVDELSIDSLEKINDKSILLFLI